MLDIREVINRPEYKWLEEYKHRLMFLTFGGSHAYGTNLPTSDIDIRGVMLPEKRTLIGINREEQKQDGETDSVLYEFNKFVNLAQNCNPNIIEMLGGKPETYIFFNDFGKELVDMKDVFLSQKAIHSFGGYATSQLRRLQNANCHDSYPSEEKEKHILAKLQNATVKNIDENQRFANKITTKIKNEEIHLNIKRGVYPLREFNAAIAELYTIAKQFDKLNHRNSKKDDAHLAKHAMHLTRLYLMCFDILENKKIVTYREKDRDLLMEIRNGQWSKTDGQMQDRFFEMITGLEEKLMKSKYTTTIPKTPNYRKIEEFVIKVNTAVVTDNVKNYNYKGGWGSEEFILMKVNDAGESVLLGAFPSFNLAVQHCRTGTGERCDFFRPVPYFTNMEEPLIGSMAWEWYEDDRTTQYVIYHREVNKFIKGVQSI